MTLERIWAPSVGLRLSKYIRNIRDSMHGSIAPKVFFLSASVAVVGVVLICVFLLLGGLPAMRTIGLKHFLMGTRWRPELELFGILPMIAASLSVTLLSGLMGVPPAIMLAVYISRYCPPKYSSMGLALVDLLAGIPSVVYGFFGLTIIVPIISRIAGGTGASLFSASIVLSMMILPTVASMTEASLSSVPPSYMEANLALGACRERGIFFIEMREAKSGILAGVILGLGRAIGETMAVIMVAGNQAIMPRGLFKGVRTLTSNIALEMGYATGLHRGALLATAVVLFAFVLVINLLLLLALKAKRAQ